ncbi:type IV secretory system conjugative DNA transfer family protein [Pseudonocardia sp. KRD291]|uniref:type IV secretory system conjugative DNA transfer family protein n=1 Tax=Pseudonocardia sp. KRD291 TaxID=2792007 RepID=UPI001C4A3AF1|nr:TraM recognition domain-containing protein [Pseudonocardia sp. KRD291]MBW0106077.1 type IV secretory system conjugative DNA transfer family protein [Pseudonocardia sp. KRD291]
MAVTARAQASQEWLLLGIVLIVVAPVVVLAVLSMAALALAGALAGGPVAWPSLPEAVISLAALSGESFAPLPAPYAALSDQRGLFWATLAVFVVVAAAVVVLLGVPFWRRWGPTPAGHATRREMRRQVSPAACRQQARYTRPTLPPGSPAEEMGTPVGEGAGGPVVVPHRHHVGIIAPTQAGKTRRLITPIALAAPGAMWCQSTKPDILLHTALARTRRSGAGPVLVLDTTDTVSWPATLKWSPITGCADPETARRRAMTLVEAAAVTVEAGDGRGAGNDRVFRERAVMVMRAYLMAAALDPTAGVDDLLTWAANRQGTAPTEILAKRGHPKIAADLKAEANMTARTADAVWMSVRRVLEPLASPRVRAFCSPAPNEAVDLRSLIGSGGTVYVVAGRRQAPDWVPLLTALAEEWLHAAQDMALVGPGERLDPPAVAVLDELTNSTPMPGLPDVISDAAGRGVLTHWAVQSVAQLQGAFGEGPAAALLENSSTKVVFGGISDATTLRWLSTVFGEHEQLRSQTQTDGFFGGGRDTRSVETVPTMRPGDVRTLGQDQVLVAHGNLRAIRARTRDLSKRRDWRHLNADAESIRGGYAEVNADGYSTLRPHG